MEEVELKTVENRTFSPDRKRVEEIITRRIGMSEVKDIVNFASQSDSNKDFLWKMSLSVDRKCSVNSLWVLTHLGQQDRNWLNNLQSQIIERLLAENDTSRKRLFLQLLINQEFSPDTPLTVKLLDYCLSKINSECEPYAVRCFSIYVAFNICKAFPELISELEEYLNMLSLQQLSPGLKSALRQTRMKIARLK